MSCGWKGNRKCDIALVVRNWLEWFYWFTNLRAHGQSKGVWDEPTFLTRFGTLYL